MSADCEGLSEAQTEVAPLALRAAQLGDLDAAICYVRGDVLLLSPRLIDHPEWLSDYRDQALSLALDAFARSDWSVVALLQGAYAHDPRELLTQATAADPAEAYRYLHLMRLGETIPQRQAVLDSELASAAQRLSPEQVGDGDAWAQETFARQFNAKPLSRSGGGCPL
jgi:hypothetical protein